MAQAKRTTRKHSAASKGRLSHGFGMLIVGIMIGSLATILWQGMRLADGGPGTGIRKVVEESLQQSLNNQQQVTSGQPVEQQTSFDFFTVLPEIETVVPDNQPAPPAETAAAAEASVPVAAADTAESGDAAATQQVAANSDTYMLQAGSYQNRDEAEGLKATLALEGHFSQIQKVTIQGRGDFFRVRLGPYSSHGEMVRADEKLASFGIEALRLKISRDG